jgi:hypothetical protein
MMPEGPEKFDNAALLSGGGVSPCFYAGIYGWRPTRFFDLDQTGHKVA